MDLQDKIVHPPIHQTEGCLTKDLCLRGHATPPSDNRTHLALKHVLNQYTIISSNIVSTMQILYYSDVNGEVLK